MRGQVYRPRLQQGFTYLLLIVGIAVLGIGLAAIGSLTSAAIAHEKNVELDWAGQQYINAIGSYFQSSPGSVSVYPRNLSDLLEDKRYLSTRHHLRELYPDPISGGQDWQLVPSLDGGVMGVALPNAARTQSRTYVYLPPGLQPPVKH